MYRGKVAAYSVILGFTLSIILAFSLALIYTTKICKGYTCDLWLIFPPLYLYSSIILSGIFYVVGMMIKPKNSAEDNGSVKPIIAIIIVVLYFIGMWFVPRLIVLNSMKESIEQANQNTSIAGEVANGIALGLVGAILVSYIKIAWIVVGLPILLLIVNVLLPTIRRKTRVLIIIGTILLALLILALSILGFSSFI